MALVFLTVLGIIILVYHWSSVSTHKMFHHTYYSEKAIALIDGLAAIARGVVQEQLEDLVDNLEEGKEKSIKDPLEAKAKELKLIDPDDAEAKRQIEPKIDAKVRMLKKQDFKDKYATVKGDDKEKVGKLEIVIEVQFKGFLTSFESGKKVAKLQYEWKKLRGIPQFFRHFALFVKNGIPQDEREEDYAGHSSNFNHLVNNRQGEAQSGGAVFVQSSGHAGLPPDKLPRAKGDKKDNPFYSEIAYVYLGGGNNKAYLNLTAGGGGGKAENIEKSQFGEDFQLYRGENTDFYRVVSTEFSNFIEGVGAKEEERAPEAKGFLKRLKEIVKSTVKGITDFFKKSFSLFKAIDRLEGANEEAHSANLPLYYVVRKDYGYAAEWGEDPKYQKFGFGSGKVVSNSLHLYNHRWQNAEPAPTVVLGNVYRRCLSLSGYKQRRAADNPSITRQFEVQAGPVEYFKDVNELVKRTCDWTKPEGGGGPVWVWDARVDWSFVEDGKRRETDGIYVPISGPALFGRLVPGLARFHEDDKATAMKLFNASIAPPDRLTRDEGNAQFWANGSDVEDDVAVSPLFVLYNAQKGFEDLNQTSNQLQAARSGEIFGNMSKKENSPYFEEMMRNFAFTSFHMPLEQRDLLKPEARDAVGMAAQVWEGLLDAIENPLIKGRVKTLDGAQIADERKKRDWVGTKPKKGLFPWSLPDPWSDTSHNFLDVLKKADEAKLFDNYFKPMMTNPGRVLPYNYSMRFWFTELKEIFSMNPKDRLAVLGKEIIPEVRDAAFGYLTTAGNDYMKAKQGETTDPPLNDDVLAQIAKKRSSDKTLQNGYFFMDDYAPGIDQPSKVSLDDIFPGDHYSYEEMTQQQFDDRFVKTKAAGADGKVRIELGTVVRVKDFTLPTCEVRGGGGIICDGTIKIAGSVEASGPVPLILKAKDFDIGPNCEKIQAIVVATKEFKWKGARECEILGNLIAETWDPYSWVSQAGAMKKLKFNATLKSDPETSPYIHNLEPRMRKFVIEGTQ